MGREEYLQADICTAVAESIEFQKSQNQSTDIARRLRDHASQWRTENGIVLSAFGHKCHSTCPFFTEGLVSVCGISNLVHICGDACDRQIMTNEAYCCELSGRVITTEFRMSHPMKKGPYDDGKHFSLRRRPMPKCRRSSILDNDGVRTTIVKTLKLIFSVKLRQPIREKAIKRFERESSRLSRRQYDFRTQTRVFQKLIDEHIKSTRKWTTNLGFVQPLATDIMNFISQLPIDKTTKKVRVLTAVLVRKITLF